MANIGKIVTGAIKGAKAVEKKLVDSGGHVKVKPAAKPVGNPRNAAKSNEALYSSWRRGEKHHNARFPEPLENVGKKRSMRVSMSKNPTGAGNASRPARSPSDGTFNFPVKINSSPLKGVSGKLGNQHMGGHGGHS